MNGRLLRSALRRIAVCTSILGMLAVPSVALSQTGGGYPSGVPDLSIGSVKLDHKDTREGWSTLIARGKNLTGQRVLAYCVADGRWEFSDGTAYPAHPANWTSVAAAAAGIGLDDAHNTGPTITLSAGEPTVTIINNNVGTTPGLTLTGSGAVAGAVSSSLLYVRSTAAHTTTGTVSLASFNFTGTVAGGTARGIEITMPANTNNALYIPVGSMQLVSGNATLSSGNLTITSGNVNHTAGNYTMSDGQLLITDTADEDSLVITNNAATTTQGIQVTANGLTTGDLFLGTSSAAGFVGGHFLRFNTGADVFVVDPDGTTTIAGTASGTDALVVTTGDILVSSGNVDLTSGNLTVTLGDVTLGNGLLSITPTDANSEAVLLTLAGARSVPAIEGNLTGAFTVAQDDWDLSAAFSGNLHDADVTGAGSGDIYEASVGAVLYTGDLFKGTLGATSTGGQGLVLTAGAAARTTSLVYLEDAGTNVGDTLAIDPRSGNASAAGIAITPTGGTFAGDAVDLTLTNAAAGVDGVVVTMPAAFTGDGLRLADNAGAATGNYVAVDVTTPSGTNVLDVDVGAALWTGDAVNVALGATSTAGQAIVITAGAAARTTDLVSIADSGTNAGHAIGLSGGTGTGDLVNGTWAGAGTGDGIDLNMNANVDGRAIKIASAGTKKDTAGIGLSIAHTGNIISAGSASSSSVFSVASSGAWDADNTTPTYLADFTQSVGAGAAGDYAVHVSATGASVEALHVDDGKSKFDETVDIGGPAGTPVVGVGLNIYPAPASYGIFIDAATAGTRPTHAGGVVYIDAQSADASSEGLNVRFTNDADVSGQAGAEIGAISGGITSPATLDAGILHITGDAGDTGVLSGLKILGTTLAAGSTAYGIRITGSNFDYDLATADKALIVGSTRETAGAGDAATFTAAQGSGAGNGGGAASFTGGAGASAGSGGAGGDATSRAGDANGDGTVARNGGAYVARGGAGIGAGNGGNASLRSGEAGAGGGADGTLTLGVGSGAGDAIVLNAAAASGGWSDVNTVAVGGTLCPTRTEYVPVGMMHSNSGAAMATWNGGPSRTMTDGAADTASFRFPITGRVDDTADISVTVAFGSAAGAGNAAWRILYHCIASGAAESAAYTAVVKQYVAVGAANTQQRASFTMANANFAAGDLCTVQLERDAADGLDTVNAAVALLGASYQYRGLTP